ncbi:hypothetical protein FOZ62_028160 [Perkinsus olseni]|uniref:Uncharacterized protein n=1 Tax=Perkinsus olseni TaxID=32597 RepID=A0A7J6SW91_PEROL|nr:hypothetical protein FOZ62_028160 [Perkinsus olseni]
MNMRFPSNNTVQAADDREQHSSSRRPRVAHRPSYRYVGGRSSSTTSVGGIRLPTVPETSPVVMPDIRTRHAGICDDDCLVDESDIRMMVRRCMVRACMQVSSK